VEKWYLIGYVVIEGKQSTVAPYSDQHMHVVVLKCY